MKIKKNSTFLKIIKFPAYILISWTILINLLPLKESNLFDLFYILNWIIQIISFILLGYIILSEELKNNFRISSAKAGWILGALLGLVYAIINIIEFYLGPPIINQALYESLKLEGTYLSIKILIYIKLYFNLLLLPVLVGSIGTIITWISYNLFKRIKK